MAAAEQQAEQPAQQHQNMQAEQAAQGPEHIDRRLPVTQGGYREAGAAGQGQQAEQQQGQARTL
ncbi:hypothetical protein SRABI70_04828 [Pseudomonas sp. Bi70]|nr:hypothetical protein SRABI70_04828 [Pseudomonas sp. Bi70]